MIGASSLYLGRCCQTALIAGTNAEGVGKLFKGSVPMNSEVREIMLRLRHSKSVEAHVFVSPKTCSVPSVPNYCDRPVGV